MLAVALLPPVRPEFQPVILGLDLPAPPVLHLSPRHLLGIQGTSTRCLDEFSVIPYTASSMCQFCNTDLVIFDREREDHLYVCFSSLSRCLWLSD